MTTAASSDPLQPLLVEVADRLSDVDRFGRKKCRASRWANARTIVGRALRSASTTARCWRWLFVYPQIHGSGPVRPDYVGLNVRRISHSPTSRTRTGLPCGLTFTITSWIGSTVRN